MQATSSMVSWLLLTLMGAFVIVTALALAMMTLALLRRGAKKEPACGKCGYATHGISQLTCPECGSDLREVGIVGGRGR